MKVRRGHIPFNEEAVYVWHTRHVPAQVGVSYGELFHLMSVDEARDFAAAVLEAVAKAEKVQQEVV